MLMMMMVISGRTHHQEHGFSVAHRDELGVLELRVGGMYRGCKEEGGEDSEMVVRRQVVGESGRDGGAAGA